MAILNSEWVWWIAQIAIDIILLVAVIILAGRLKARPRGNLAAAREQAAFAAGDFMEQAGLLVSEFDRLLGEKRELVGTTLATLDARIEELRAMLDQAESRHSTLSSQIKTAPPRQAPAATRAPVAPQFSGHEPEAEPPSAPFNLPPGHPLHAAMADDGPLILSEHEFREKVMKMAASGHSAQAIALATGRPRAEVELVLALLK